MTRVITAAEQLDLMETIACTSGSNSYEQIRDEMWEVFKREFGRFEMDSIPEERLNRFLEWLREDS